MKKKLTLSIIAAIICIAVFVAFKVDYSPALDQHAVSLEEATDGSPIQVTHLIEVNKNLGYRVTAMTTYPKGNNRVMFVIVFQK